MKELTILCLAKKKKNAISLSCFLHLKLTDQHRGMLENGDEKQTNKKSMQHFAEKNYCPQMISRVMLGLCGT